MSKATKVFAAEVAREEIVKNVEQNIKDKFDLDDLRQEVSQLFAWWRRHRIKVWGIVLLIVGAIGGDVSRWSQIFVGATNIVAPEQLEEAQKKIDSVKSELQKNIDESNENISVMEKNVITLVSEIEDLYKEIDELKKVKPTTDDTTTNDTIIPRSSNINIEAGSLIPK